MHALKEDGVAADRSRFRLGGDGRRRRLLGAGALGERPADLAIRNGRVVEVHTGAILDADLAIADGHIVAVGDVDHATGPETQIFDAEGSFLAPGFIDAHMHVVSSQLPLPELARLLVARGTTAISTCLIETALLAGRAGVELMLERARETPLTVLFSPLAYSYLGPDAPVRGCSPEDLRALVDRSETVEIREWSVLEERSPEPVLSAFVDAARESGRILAGHLEGLDSRELQASAALGVVSDHEATTAEQALERAQLGIHVAIREGIVGSDLARVAPAVTELGADPRMFQFCCDEDLSNRLAELGHMDRCVRLAIEAGIPAMEAIRMATLNPAQQLRVDADLGSLAPGRKAHVNVIDDLEACTVRAVIAGDRVVARDGRCILAAEPVSYPSSFRGTMHVARPLGPEDFVIPAPTAGDSVPVRVMAAVSDTILTDELVLAVPASGGRICLDRAAGLVKIAAIDRHLGDGAIGLGLSADLGLRRGAFALTANPGLMQLMAAGADDGDMALAANRVAELDGGIAVALQGEIVAELALPLLGVFSDRPAEEVVDAMGRIVAALELQLGSPDGNATLADAAFRLCLASLPRLRLSTEGLVRVGRDGSVEPVGLIVEDEAG